MNRRKKGGNNSLKPPALAKPPATTSPSPATASTTSARVSPPPKAPSPPHNVAPAPKTMPQPVRSAAQAPRPTPSPPKAPVPIASAMKTAIPSAKPAVAQKRVVTRSDLVRAEWYRFDQSWVKQRQLDVEKKLSQMLDAAEKNPRVKGKALNQHMDKIVNSVRREFAMAARAEWDACLEKAGLQAEDWADMTVEEMQAVEQVLSCEEDVEVDAGVYALSQRTPATPAPSVKPAVESSPPLASRPINGHTAPPAPPVNQPAKAGWGSWMSEAFLPRKATVADVPNEQSKPAPAAAPSPWAAKHGPIIEDRTPPKADPAPQPPQAKPRVAPLATKSEPAIVPSLPSHGLLSYAVPISLTMASLDPRVDSDSELVKSIDNLYLNSIMQFHKKAADADVKLARQLRKPMPAAEREWTLRAHTMEMEQMARDIVQRRDTLVDEALEKRGYGHDGGDATPMTARPPAPQPPGAFPFTDDHIRVAAVPEPEPELEEPERELEPDVDEVIEIPLKGKAAKKAKKTAQAKATNGRSTPTPSPVTTTRTATPAAKATPVVERKPAPAPSPAPAVSPWAARAATPAGARAASPAPINTKVSSAPAANGRATPALSPWEAVQAAKTNGNGPSKVQPPEKPPSPPNGMWAPPMARQTSSKNPYAPSRPSRLAQVSEPESPEPPSPPPTGEPTGKDYVAWFAGSSSEDEGGAGDDGLSEDEDEEDEDESGGEAGGAAFGGLLASLAGASPWAMFGEGSSHQPQKERGRAADPVRTRGATATPTPGFAAGGRFGADMGMGHGMGMGMGMGTEMSGGGGWQRWGAGGGDAGPPGGFGSSSFGAGPSGFGGPNMNMGVPRGGRQQQWNVKNDDDDLDDMLELASKTLDRAAVGAGGRGPGVNMEEAMAMFVTAQKARETLSTPGPGQQSARAASAWRR